MKPQLLQKLADTKLLGRDAVGSESEQDTSCETKDECRKLTLKLYRTPFGDKLPSQGSVERC